MNDISEQLLPCPFCGSIPSIDNISTSYRPDSPPLWDIRCENNNCKSQAASSSESKTEAIAAWNTRTPRKLDAETDCRLSLAKALFEASYGMDLKMWSDETRDYWLARADAVEESARPWRDRIRGG